MTGCRQERLAGAVLGAVAVGLVVVGLCYGTTWSSPGEVFDALFTGRGDHAIVITHWRLPRIVAALVFGAALALSGAVFQGLTRNPLGSPDVIGLDAGAYTGALVALTVLGGGAAAVTGASLLGGVLTAAVVYVLSLRSGHTKETESKPTPTSWRPTYVSPIRNTFGRIGIYRHSNRALLLVVGIGVNATLTAVNSWIVLRAELDVAIAATGWSAGSLNGIDWADLGVPCLVLGAFSAVLATHARALRQTMLGDDLAVATGVRLGRVRLHAVLAGVGCTAMVTAITGPIVFIALAAPQISRRLFGSVGTPLLPAALTGGVLLLAADLLAQALLAPVALPVGVVTTALGGGYLFWLVRREARSRT